MQNRGLHTREMQSWPVLNTKPIQTKMVLNTKSMQIWLVLNTLYKVSLFWTLHQYKVHPPHTHARTHARTHAHTHTVTHTHTLSHTHTHTHTHTLPGYMHTTVIDHDGVTCTPSVTHTLPTLIHTIHTLLSVHAPTALFGESSHCQAVKKHMLFGTDRSKSVVFLAEALW